MSFWAAAFGGFKVVKGGELAGSCDFEESAVAVGAETGSSSVKISVAGQDERVWIYAITAIELSEDGHLTRRSDLENSASTIQSSDKGGSIKVAIGGFEQTQIWKVVVKGCERSGDAVRREPKDSAASVCAAAATGSIEIAIASLSNTRRVLRTQLELVESFKGLGGTEEAEENGEGNYEQAEVWSRDLKKIHSDAFV
jgi:hypothetical protein